MDDLAELFPGFAPHYVSTDAGRLFVRIAGRGDPLLLLHGFPESGVMWHRIAAELAERFTVVVPDLRGYGWSAAPDSHGGEGYTKRTMGADLVAVMDHFGHARFAYAGHDRGARIGYRLALDHPGRVSRLVLLDIEPTFAVWDAIEAGRQDSPHWLFLAKPAPEPETRIAADAFGYYTDLVRKWVKDGDLARIDPRALAHYRAAWGDPSRIHASCEDYRAGARQDRQADVDDLAAGKRITCPVHLLASRHYLMRPGQEPPLSTWQRSFAPEATGTEIDSGHFMAEENPAETLAAMQRFLTA